MALAWVLDALAARQPRRRSRPAARMIGERILRVRSRAWRLFLLDKGKPIGVVFTLMAFGTFEDHHHTRVPAHRLVENRARLDVFQLNRAGALVDGAETELAWGENPYRLAMHEGNLSVNGVSIEVTWTDWNLAWLLCP